MRLNRLRLVSFRNFDRQEFAFAPGVNLFVGQNGQGKTNLLEAIYLLGYGRSFRTAIPRECIRHGAGSGVVSGSVESSAGEREIGVEISEAGKRLQLFGKEASLEEFVGTMAVMAFTTEHLVIVRGAPGERRAFLDRAMVAIYPGHLRRLALYGRALRQRNELLRRAVVRGGAPDPALLESWDEKLASEGGRIIFDRRRFVEEMRSALPRVMPGGSEVELEYAGTVPADDDNPAAVAARFRAGLAATRPGELRAGHTLLGPHRDELRLALGGRSLARYGSAGQQRGALLSLYFAQMEVHRRVHGTYPIFLLDDVEAELDSARLEAVLCYLGERTQTFLTTAKEAFLPEAQDGVARYVVEGGRARREGPVDSSINN